MVIGFMYRNGIVKEGCIQEDWRSTRLQRERWFNGVWIL